MADDVRRVSFPVNCARIRRMTANRPTTEPIVGPMRSPEMKSTRGRALVG
jgi:hypothetical protein